MAFDPAIPERCDGNLHVARLSGTGLSTLDCSRSPIGSAAVRDRNVCKTCIELDQKIEEYARLSRAITDEWLLDRIAQAIERAKAHKAALHPEKINPERDN